MMSGRRRTNGAEPEGDRDRGEPVRGEKLRVIGVAGPMGAGKNAVASILVERGFLEIDVDRLGHEALRLRRDEVVARFGRGILRIEVDGGERDAGGGSGNSGDDRSERGGNREIDRKALGRIVFADEGARRDLEAIVHPWMRSRVEAIVTEHPDRSICINAAILFPMGLGRLCDLVLWVQAPFPVRLYRTVLRDRTPILRAYRRLRAQKSIKPQHSSETVDICTVRNAGSRRFLEERIDRILSRYGR